MNDLDDLLDRIDTPPLDVAADVARGERALRRRHGWQASAAGLSVAAVAATAVALGGSSPARDSSQAPSFLGGPDAGVHSQQHHQTRARHHDRHRLLTVKQRLRQLNRQLNDPETRTVLQTYRDVLAQHLDPGGTRLGPVNGQLGGTGSFGTKLDWNHGGELMIVAGTAWDRFEGFYGPDVRVTPTTFHGDAARTTTYQGDLIVSVRHPDGTIVTLVASSSFGNNGTSASSLDLTTRQLLAAAADRRIVLPSYLR
ncbi:MAG TPA: hypothetical protein VHW64_05185 [Nocardioides sp.]|jgi:hypothetical protein|uniref:hypothetical protein n=1 Tax=Nocardioides sp. TaxID=35761 RepID=UPI002E355749|nr:hypothetical protein [Nocardioides sp.]HEX3930073.1 hypothetical protein [Nocardioides sp.]